MNSFRSLTEPARETRVCTETDVLVAGGGPAGALAAVAAARAGATVQLIDVAGCLGGIWTAGLLSWIIDVADKAGLPAEFVDRLAHCTGEWHGSNFLTTPETCKRVLEEMCRDAGVRLRLHTRVVGAAVNDRRVTHTITESKSGREAWAADIFIDATGDGDLGALAGCGWDYANPETGKAQPFSLIGLVGGIDLDDVADCVRGVAEPRGLGPAKPNLLAEMRRHGLDPSYSDPFMAHLGHNIFVIMWNHLYGGCAFAAEDVTRATLNARAELHRLVDGLRAAGGRWRNLHLLATADQIGTREGRRLHGRDTVTAADIRAGRQRDDGICTVNFGFDVHATDPAQGKGYEPAGKARAYQIPRGALIAADRENLLFAGRCLSGDFLAHSSYRVTGNAAATGTAAGELAAALAAM